MSKIGKLHLLKYRELKKLILEYSFENDSKAIQDLAKLLMVEVKEIHKEKNILDQIEEAKRLFIMNPNKYLGKKLIEISI